MSPTPALAAEFQHIEEDAEQRRDHCFRKNTHYTWLHYGLGVPAVVLSAIAGAAALQEAAPELIASFAIALVLLTGLQTFLNPAVRTQYRDNAIDYERLRDDAKIARELDLPSMDDEKARAQLNVLRSRRYELMKRSGGSSGAGTAPNA
jgi:hypothetical protein